MASGFSAGGAPDFFSGRSTTMTNQPQHPPPTYRTQLPGLHMDPSIQSIQIARQQAAASSLIGKRTLADSRTPQFQNPAGLNSLFLRSVKPRRTYQHSSPISTLSPIDFSTSTPTCLTSSPEASSLLLSLPQQQQRLGLHLLQQQFRPQPIDAIGNSRIVPQHNTATIPTLPGVPYMNTTTMTTTPVNSSVPQDRLLSSAQDLSEQKMMNHRLQELEKQLLDDDDDNGDEGDAASVITSTNSEWSETIQNLISSTPKPTSPSPTSSTSSSTSSNSSVPSPGSACLKQSLMEAATNILEGRNDSAGEILTRLAQVSSNSKGNSEERLMSYMVATLKSRMNPSENPPPIAELFSKEHAEATQLLYEMSPCFKLGFMAAYLAILEAALEEESESSNRIHVIDFDVGQGYLYVNLLRALSGRQKGKPFAVKITAVSDSDGARERLEFVGKMLIQEAEKVGVSLSFQMAESQKLGELTRESLGCEPDEPLAVNFAFKLCRMPDESVSTENPRDELLRRVKAMEPRVVTLVEQEMNANTAPFLARVGETCAYYGAMFESMEAMWKRDDANRVKVEEGLSRRLGNSVACEGRDRVERCEMFGKWRARMGMAGFQLRPLGRNVAETMRAQLNGVGSRVSPGFTVSEENGGVCFGWMGRALTVASAWR
ncbi:scarecrow-like protein 8 [Alnus glutinosa]|uniref:scarecrow-like protein 8 n=1 Tax=Alnus glutinosa TaxID=3517 RepID=UPI002D7A3599|nr:scarecrow-like protein 8 [Alnus glutinosa]